MRDILSASRKQGWVLEPDAKLFLKLADIPVPRYKWVKRLDKAVEAASKIGYPVVGKIVSPKIMHKSDSGGVILGIDNERKLEEIFNKFKSFSGFEGMLVEETLDGIELIVGAKMDYQFGAVILLGIGGTGVEVYQDTSIRMAPITVENVFSMIDGLKARQLIEGCRGNSRVNVDKLSRLLLSFSDLVMHLETRFDSIDLNPIMCTKESCVVADARIVLNTPKKPLSL
jgi:succinyl-CoA synthetase beta subunit